MSNIYRELYYFLFNRITDAGRLLEAGECERARALLAGAQREAEERYVGAQEDGGKA